MRAGQAAEAEHAMVLQALMQPARRPFEPVPLHPERRGRKRDQYTSAKADASAIRSATYRDLRAKGFKTSAEMTVLADVSPRQLQWWDERGVARPLMFGRARLYSPDVARKVQLTRDLRRLGFQLSAVRKLLDKPDVLNWLNYDVTPTWMLTNGRRMILTVASDLAEKMLAAQSAWTGRIVLVRRPPA